LLSNDTINKQQSWIDNFPLAFLGSYLNWNSCESSACSHTNYGTHIAGQWQNVNNGFVGLKLLVNTDTLYGWVRMDVSLKSFVIIQDYAYDTIPNEPILAGDKGDVATSLQTISEKTFQIFPNPTTSSFELNYSITAPTPFIIYDAFGRVVKELMLDASSKTITISTADLADGVYLLTLADRDKRISKKLIISR
jgi:hypothetical protein